MLGNMVQVPLLCRVVQALCYSGLYAPRSSTPWRPMSSPPCTCNHTPAHSQISPRICRCLTNKTWQEGKLESRSSLDHLGKG
jgi:hypothetical protein